MFPLTLVFKGCLKGFAFPLAKFTPGEKGLGRTVLLNMECVRGLLEKDDFEFPHGGDLFISEGELIRALGDMKKFKAPLFLPKPVWHR